MKAERIRQINEELLRRTGVDFSAYRNQELVDTLANAVTFPLFLARSISRPVGAFLLATIVAIVLVESNVYEVLLALAGFPLALLNGVLLGLVLFVRRIRKDMGRIFEISAGLTTRVLGDIGTARARLSASSASFPNLLEIFQGVNAIVVLPVLVQLLKGRLPLLGGLAARVTERFFSLVDLRLAAAVKARNASATQTLPPASPEQVSAWLQSAEKMIESGHGLLDGIVDKAAKVIAFPFLAVFTAVFALSAAILLGAYALIA